MRIVAEGHVRHAGGRRKGAGAQMPSRASSSREPSRARPGASATTRPAEARATSDRVIAQIPGSTITLGQLDRPLIEGYGLNLLLNMVQLELAKQDAQRQGIVVSQQDIDTEREQTMARLFKDADKSEYDQLFDQFLQQQRISRPEFEIVMETNAYLRKIAEPQLKGKVTEENVKEAFNQMYGETVQVRHIQCANMTEILEAKRRLAEGQTFERVAQDVSRNQRTAALGGELPPFSRATAGYPQAFKDTAFALKVGEISDPVQADGAFHLIKLERRIQPKAVEFDKVKQSVRSDLEDRLEQAAIKQMRAQLAQQTLESIKIEDPTLKAEFDAPRKSVTPR